MIERKERVRLTEDQKSLLLIGLGIVLQRGMSRFLEGTLSEEQAEELLSDIEQARIFVVQDIEEGQTE